MRELTECNSVADKLLATQHGVHSRQQLRSCIDLDDIARCARTHGFLHDIRGGFLAYKQNDGAGRDLTYFAGGLYAIQPWKSDIQQNQIRLQFFRPLNRFQAIQDSANHLQFGPVQQRQGNKFLKLLRIFNDENANEGNRQAASTSWVPARTYLNQWFGSWDRNPCWSVLLLSYLDANPGAGCPTRGFTARPGNNEEAMLMASKSRE